MVGLVLSILSEILLNSRTQLSGSLRVSCGAGSKWYSFDPMTASLICSQHAMATVTGRNHQ